MMREDLLKGLTLERIEGSNIVIARKEIVVPYEKELFSSGMFIGVAKKFENCTYKSNVRGGVL